ncbi:MAG: hypothetical protein QOG33_2243 [Gaiellales bacterium]|nr:hypothetical protein [Gaiellales bacterium]
MMGARIRSAIALAMAAGCLAAMAGPAEAATSSQLLARYQPVTMLDPLEQFAPTTVNSFVGDSTLQVQTAPGVWSVVDANPSVTDLPVGGTATYRLDQSTCSPTGGLDAVACYHAAWAADAAPSVVYGRAAYTRRHVVLQYWYFYYDDLYSYDYPPDSLFWQAHEGDWEVVTVVLSRHGHQPQYAAYSQHCTGERRSWANLDRVGTHPVDHVAIGSHANLFDGGSHAVATQCIPPQALAILQANGLPAPVDRSLAGGQTLGPGSTVGITRTAVRPLTLRGTPWVAFAGTWGEDQVFHAPPPIGTVTFGTSPASPALTALWNTPLATIGSWPVG